MTCPQCGSIDIHGEQRDSACDQFTTVVECYCDNCGCEWDETITIEITKEGTDEEEEE